MKKNRHSESTLWCSVMLCALCSLQSRFVGCNDVQEEHHLLTRPKRHWAGAKSIAHRRRNPLSCWHQPKTHAAKTTWRPKRRSSDATTDARRTSAKTSASPMRLTWIDMDWQRRFLSIATDVATHSNRLLHVSFVEGNGCAIRSKFRSVKQLLSLNLNSSHAFDAFEIHLLPGSFTMGKQTDKTDVCIGLFWQRDSNACCASLKYHAYIQEEWVDTVSFGSLAQWAQHPLRSGI